MPGTPSPQSPVPEICVPYTEMPSGFDGSLSAACWKDAAVIREWAGPMGEARGSGTTCRLLWSSSHLLLGFHTEDSDIFATRTERDDLLWKEDVFEIFLDPEGQGRNYFEFQFNALGGIFDAFFLGEPTKVENGALWSYDCKGLISTAKWDRDARTGADIGWSVEIGIPYTSLMRLPHTPPEPGDTWRANFVRRDYPDRMVPEEWYWSPSHVPRWPHVTERFGILRFIR